MFDNGRRKRFFELWSENFHQTVHNGDVTFEQLEFYLNVYFAIYARKHQSEVSCNFHIHFSLYLSLGKSCFA